MEGRRPRRPYPGSRGEGTAPPIIARTVSGDYGWRAGLATLRVKLATYIGLERMAQWAVPGAY